MAVQKTMNIVATTGTYTNQQCQEKKRYLTVGTLFIYDDGGMSIKLDAVPTHFDGNLAIYERENKNQSNNSQANNQGGYQQPTYEYTDANGTQQNQQQAYPRQ